MEELDVVSNPAVAREKYAEARRLTRDFCGGTTAVHARAEVYTPREGSQTTNDNLREDALTYSIRSKWTEVYTAVKAAKDASIGLVLAQPPVLGKDVPPALADWTEDVDGRGNHLMIFSRAVLDDGLVDGLCGTLVDLPEWPQGLARNEEVRIRNNIRASWSRYLCDDIINWEYTKVGAVWMLTFLVLRECGTEKTSTYGQRETVRYRELRLDVSTGVVSVQVWKQNDYKATPTSMNDFTRELNTTIEAKPSTPLGYIPFSVFYAQKPEDSLLCAPPLAPIAELNLGYYRTASDRRWSMHLHFSPVLKIVGREPGPDGLYTRVRLGVGAVIDVPQGGDVGFVNPGGEAFVPSEKELLRISQEMGSLSLAFLANDQGSAQETATARRLESESGKATLSLLAQNLQDHLETLLMMTSDFLGLPDRNLVEVEIKLIYDLQQLDASTITALNTVVKDNNMTLETFLAILKRGGVLPDNVDSVIEALNATNDRLDAETRAADVAAVAAAAKNPPARKMNLIKNGTVAATLQDA